MPVIVVPPCKPPLTSIPGTGFNIVDVPGVQGASYPNVTDQLLYEIWQTLLLILAANPPAVSIPIIFTIGDGQAGTPIAGTNSIFAPSLQGQSLANKQLLVLRNGIQLEYTNGVTHLDIIRHNNGTNAGFTFDAAGSNLTFQTGENYQIFIIGINTTNE